MDSLGLSAPAPADAAASRAKEGSLHGVELVAVPFGIKKLQPRCCGVSAASQIGLSFRNPTHPAPDAAG